MKKVLTTGLLAICVIAVARQEASAWINSRFGVGLNWDYSSGGNSAVWGLWRNSQPGQPLPAHVLYPQPQCAPLPAYGPPVPLMPAPVPAYGSPVPLIPAPAPAYGSPVPLMPAQAPAYIPPTPLPHSFDAPPPHHPAHARPKQYGPPVQVATYPRPAYYYYYGQAPRTK